MQPIVSEQQTLLLKVCCAAPAQQLLSLQWLKVIFLKQRKGIDLFETPLLSRDLLFILAGQSVAAVKIVKCGRALYFRMWKKRSRGQKHVGDNKSRREINRIVLTEACVAPQVMKTQGLSRASAK